MKHLNQIRRAINFIENRLRAGDGEALKIDAIAREAGMSLWHFQRVFNGITGETVAAYIRKHNLVIAAALLRDTDQRIIDISLSSGFENQQSFTRAFARFFSCSPAKFRQEKRIIPPVFLNTELSQRYLDHLYGGLNLLPEIENFKPVTLIGIETSYYSVLSQRPDNLVKIPALWDQFKKRLKTIPVEFQKEKKLYGIIDWVGMKNITDPIRYFAGIPGDRDTPVPQGFLKYTIKGGPYAAFLHTGPISDIQHTVNYAHGIWLSRQSSHDLREDAEIEIFDLGSYSPMHYLLPIQAR